MDPSLGVRHCTSTQVLLTVVQGLPVGWFAAQIQISHGHRVQWVPDVSLTIIVSASIGDINACM